MEAKNNHIHNNTIAHNMIGIYLNLCKNTHVHNNTIGENNYGIYSMWAFLLNGCYNTSIHSTLLIKNNIGISLNSGSQTHIHNNTFIHNTRSATFYLETTAHWNHNYWDRARHLPKIILGKAGFFIFRYPYLNFDLHPGPAPFPI